MKESNPYQTCSTGWQPTGLPSKNYVNRTNWVLMMCWGKSQNRRNMQLEWYVELRWWLTTVNTINYPQINFSVWNISWKEERALVPSLPELKLGTLQQHNGTTIWYASLAFNLIFFSFYLSESPVAPMFNFPHHHRPPPPH